MTCTWPATGGRLLAIVLPIGLFVGLVLAPAGDDPSPASTARPTLAPSAAPLPESRAPVLTVQPGDSGPRPAPSSRPPPSIPARTAADALDALDAGEALAAGDEALLAAALDDPAAEAPLRAGALRALLRRRGRALLPALPALFARPDAAPLRPILAACLAHAAGPEDAPLLRALLDAGQASGEPAALLLAVQATLGAARRDAADAPTRLEATDSRRLLGHLEGFLGPDQAGETRAAALESLARLGGGEARATLLRVAVSAPDPEDRLEAALLLRELDPAAAAAPLEALAVSLEDPLLRDRLEQARAD